jgi:Ca2+-binding RTX toxin-like protein
VTVSGTTGQAGDHVSIYYGPYLLGTDVTGSDGKFHITGDALDGVTHIYRAVATDSGGHAADFAGTFILGSAGENELNGTSSADLIAGRGSHDAITGEGGADKLIGGGGNDNFNYTSASDSTSAASDTITDFRHGSDKIDFTQIAGISATKGVPLFQGNIGGSGNHTLNAHSIAFMEVGGQTVVLANTSGNAETVTSTDHHAADMKIVLTGVNLGLAASDFHHA